MSTWKDFSEIFGVNLEPNSQLGRTIDDNYRSEKATVEITINVPRYKAYKQMPLCGQMQVYRDLWEVVKQSIPSNKKIDRFEIEYCKDGYPHLHGYLSYHDLTTHYPEGLVMDIVRAIYKKLPRNYYKQIADNPYNNALDRFKSPAVCINYKHILQDNWTSYMSKTQCG